MALPTMTPEQRAAALAKAAQVRTERAQLKTSLKDGTLTLAEVLADTREVVTKLKVTALLESLPGMGKARAKQLMGQIGIAESRRVRGLGAGQRAALEAAFAPAPA